MAHCENFICNEACGLVDQCDGCIFDKCISCSHFITPPDYVSYCEVYELDDLTVIDEGGDT